MAISESEYLRLLPILNTVLAAGINDLGTFLEEEGVHLASPVGGRIKAWPSVQAKVDRKGTKINGVAEISDLVGFRIIVLFENEIERAGIAAERLFKFHERERTQLRLVSDQFGYSSLHYSMSADWDWLNKLGIPASYKVPIEVQVRTMAQHVWAAASHVLQYKDQDAVPPEVRRSVSRLAALTELLDLELTRIADQRNEYLARKSQFPESESLNVETLEQVLGAVWPIEYRHADEPYSAVLTSLSKYGLRTPGQLGAVLLKQRESVLQHAQREAMRYKRNLEKEEFIDNELIVRRPSHTVHGRFDQRTLDRLQQGVFYSHTGLTFVALKREFEDAEPDRNRL